MVHDERVREKSRWKDSRPSGVGHDEPFHEHGSYPAQRVEPPSQKANSARVPSLILAHVGHGYDVAVRGIACCGSSKRQRPGQPDPTTVQSVAAVQKSKAERGPPDRPQKPKGSRHRRQPAQARAFDAAADVILRRSSKKQSLRQ